MKAPQAQKIAKELNSHDHIRIDHYYWMNDRENPDVIEYLNQENDFTEHTLTHTKGLQKTLYDEMVGRIKQTDMSVPYFYHGYYYFARYEEGKEYPIYSRKKDSLDNDEEIMLDVNELAKDQSYYQIGAYEVSPNNKLLAYAEDTVSRRIYDIRFKNLETGEILEDKLANNGTSLAWSNDNEHIFYTIKDETLRTAKIYRHKLGTDQKNDVLIFEENDDTFYTFVYQSKSRNYIVIGSTSTMTSEYQILDANNPLGEFQIIQPRTRGLEYGIYDYKDELFILTNHEAKNFRLMKTPISNPSLENWTEVLAHRENVLLEDLDIFENFMVLSERENGLTQLRVISSDNHVDYYIPFEEEVFMASSSLNPEYNTDIFRFGYGSLTTPSSVFDFDMKTKDRTLLKQQEVVGGYDPKEYHAERKYVTTRDGVKVPLSLVYKKSLKADSNDLLLYGYGSYGSSMDPYFSSARLSLLDRGFVFAIAHIRGGEEMGREWYENGKLHNKMNTFNDFIDCGDFLISEGYTTKEKLYAMGGSAGGMLMGVIVNERPELFNGVVAQVPFVDCVTTMLDDSIPLTTGEYDEWGNPNEKEYYETILSYSPYDNIKEHDYPAMLVTSGLHDSQVQYWEPTKWVAKLRDHNTGSKPILLMTNMETGHSGASGRFESFKEIALEYAFLIDLTNK
ncbi:S9 family peptidase [Aureibacter tunicatorum]|uniref:Proline-specific endopeptidase n=1 Tax=Aureibacter tunicatorum TaxID=866807 RepID=A0AAE3XK13_9BACT|nr:S9 family peptidase [Aureibacter tunicatorum]MDR6237935.1 oligopeptidase B [Aureibacter tunicatorum]BDD02968.1 oligopeptidase B [Aureibacter tunicatorum]